MEEVFCCMLIESDKIILKKIIACGAEDPVEPIDEV